MDFIKKNINKITIIIIYILIMFILPDLLNEIFDSVITTKDQALAYSCILNISLYGLMFISAIILLRDELKSDFKILYKTPAIRTLLIVLIGLVGGYCCVFIGNFITSMLSGSNDTSINEMGIREMISSKYGWMLIPTTVLIGPIVEELVFRKALTSILRDCKINNSLVIFISSVLFGLIHVVSNGDFVQVFPYIAMGVAFGLIESNAKNIFPSTIVHVMNNYIAIVLQIILGM